MAGSIPSTAKRAPIKKGSVTAPAAAKYHGDRLVRGPYNIHSQAMFDKFQFAGKATSTFCDQANFVERL
jgi:hypothetical protein